MLHRHVADLVPAICDIVVQDEEGGQLAYGDEIVVQMMADGRFLIKKIFCVTERVFLSWIKYFWVGSSIF